MYIIQNAWKSIVRSKGRNILIGIIALIIALSGCLALSIRQAAETAREETLSQMSITAQISFDRSGAMEEMAGQMQEPPEGEPGEGGGFNREDFDFESLAGEALTLDDYMIYTEALSDGDSYYYTMSASLNASGDLVPYGESEEEETTETDTRTETTQPEMPGGGMGGGRMDPMGGFSPKGTAREFLGKVGLNEEEMQRRVLKLSGGQQHRVAIARAISYEPREIWTARPRTKSWGFSASWPTKGNASFW